MNPTFMERMGIVLSIVGFGWIVLGVIWALAWTLFHAPIPVVITILLIGIGAAVAWEDE